MTVSVILVNPEQTATVFAGTCYTSEGNEVLRPGGVYKSTNGGGRWSTANTGLVVSSISALAIDPITPANLYASVLHGDLYKSTDGGWTWRLAGTGLPGPILRLVVNPVVPTTLYASPSIGPGLYKSTDGGVNWSLPG